MLNKIINIKREFNSTVLCEICFTTAQKANLYRLDLGFENNGVINKRSKVLCNACLRELKEKINSI